MLATGILALFLQPYSFIDLELGFAEVQHA